MSTATTGHTGKALYNPEDVRVGETLQGFMWRTEINEDGYMVRRRITHPELAKGIRLPGKPNGVDRSYISQLCSGARHMNNDMLYAIAHYLGVKPIAIKVPDGFDPAQRNIFELVAA
jgi:hypothetical protein